MLFIVSSNVEKVDSVTRKLIRSHVMRGKKQKGGRHEKAPRVASRPKAARSTQAVQAVDLDDMANTFAPLFPCRAGLRPSSAVFPDDIEATVIQNMKTISIAARKIVFPLMMAIGFQPDTGVPHNPIGSDPAALYISAFAVQRFIDRVLRRQDDGANPTARLHLQRGLRLLRERLLGDDDQAKVSNSTMNVVLKLVDAAYFDGDYQTAKHHMDGLRRMADLRGGIDALSDKRLSMEIRRGDLRIAVLSGSKPVFFRQPSEPVIEYPEKLMPAPGGNTYSQDDAELIQNLDDELATAWRAMRTFCLLVGLGTQTQRQLYTDFIYDTMAAVNYRLLYMGFPAGSLDEAVRLGLLAFSYHAFLQWQDVRMPYDHFPSAYRSCILSLNLVHGTSPPLMLWLLMTGATSLFEMHEEPWLEKCLREHIGRCQVATWKDMQALLKSFMWIEMLDEQPARQIYDSLRASEENSPHLQTN